MSSLMEELQRREAAARREVDELRGEIAQLNERLTQAEEKLSRLEITRETVAEILGGAGAGQPAAGQAVGAVVAAGLAPAGSRLSGGSPVGVLTVPPWRPGLAQSVLPSSYRDLLEVLVDAGRPLRAGRIAAAAGLSTDKSKVEGLRSKLNGWWSAAGWPRTGLGCLWCPAAMRGMRQTRPPEGSSS
jgi:hypothetical protein